MNTTTKLPLLARIIIWFYIALLIVTVVRDAVLMFKSNLPTLLMIFASIAFRLLIVLAFWHILKIKRWALVVFNIWLLLGILGMAIILMNPQQLSGLGLPINTKQGFFGVWLTIVINAAILLYFNFGEVKKCFKETP